MNGMKLSRRTLKERDTQLDAYRAYLMIYMVCIVHSVYWFNLGSEPLRSAILFEMPLVFFISGASQSFKRGAALPTFRKFVSNRAWRVLFPFYVFLSMTILSVLAASFVVPSVARNLNSLTLLSWLNALLTFGGVPFPYYSHTWFISVYFVITCSFPLQAKLLQHIPGVVYLAVNTALVTTLSFADFPSMWLDLRQLLVYNVFFIAGYLYYRNMRMRYLCIVAAVSVPLALTGIASGLSVPMQDYKFSGNIRFLVLGVAWLSLLSILLTHVRLPYNRMVAVWNVRGYTIYLYQIFAAVAAGKAVELCLSYSSNMIPAFCIAAFSMFAINTAMSRYTYTLEQTVKRMIVRNH